MLLLVIVSANIKKQLPILIKINLALLIMAFSAILDYIGFITIAVFIKASLPLILINECLLY